jgi:DNA-binding response OmpR family regulator
VYEDAARRKTVRKAIERAGCVALEVSDGEAALSYACRLRPDAVITDIALQRLDGLGLLQALVVESIVEHVFVYTDQRDSALLEWARELGAADVMTIDDDVELLATRIRAKLGTGAVVRRVS